MPFNQTRAAYSSKRIAQMLLPVALLVALWLLPFNAFAQSRNKKSIEKIAPTVTNAPPALVRKTTKHEVRRLGYGSTLTVLGAPFGSITIEAWSRSEVDITADIELRAESEADLTRLAAINNFLVQADPNHIHVITTGTHDKTFMRRAAKDFPKNLLSLPWKIDYHIRAPAFTDLEIDMGRGAFSLAGIDGAIKLTALESDATLALTGGQIAATIGRGSVYVKLLARNWRGAGADVRLANGDMTVELPPNMSADINASVLRTGQIENTYAALEPRDDAAFEPRSIKARAGAGGPTLAFTVGDGTLRIKTQSKENND
jgi:hypothetical protein